MDANATLAKTAKGADEVARHAHGLPNRLRSLLITVDGRATAGALISSFGEAAETESRLQYLIDQGFVEKTRAWDPALLEDIESRVTVVDATPTAARDSGAPKPTNENPATRAGSVCASIYSVQLAAAREAKTSEGDA